MGWGDDAYHPWTVVARVALVGSCGGVSVCTIVTVKSEGGDGESSATLRWSGEGAGVGAGAAGGLEGGAIRDRHSSDRPYGESLAALEVSSEGKALSFQEQEGHREVKGAAIKKG